MKVLFGYPGSHPSDPVLGDLELAGLPVRLEALVLTGSGQVDPGFGARHPGWKITAMGGMRDPAAGILDAAGRWKPDLIVTGADDGNPLARLFLGSASQKVLNRAGSDVRIVRSRIRDASGPPRILIGFHGSLESRNAVAALACRSWPAGTRVRLLTVLDRLPISGPRTWPSETELRLAEEARRAFLDKAVGEAREGLSASGLEVEAAFAKGNPGAQLLHDAEAWKADAIFLGGRGLGALGRALIETTSSGVAAKASCTVEVIRRQRPWHFSGGKR